MDSWDEAYARELTNNADDAEDEGTIWFDDTGAEDKVIQLLDDLGEDSIIARGPPTGAKFLDLGTGNGHFLFVLREEGWQGELIGVDYSDTSVQLARQILKSKDYETSNISFHRWDILAEEPGQWMGEGFDVVHDKGTFDAISLSAETDTQGRRICETYRDRVVPLVKPGMFLIITSCNWTKEELLGWFAGGPLELYKEVKYPTFTFGGQEGQSVVTLAFRRKES